MGLCISSSEVVGNEGLEKLEMRWESMLGDHELLAVLESQAAKLASMYWIEWSLHLYTCTRA